MAVSVCIINICDTDLRDRLLPQLGYPQELRLLVVDYRSLGEQLIEPTLPRGR